MSKPKTGEVVRRHAVLTRESVDEENRTVEVAFSSEEEVERWYGIEILDHTEGSVRLGRLADGGAVLVDHDRRDHVGVVESVSIDKDRTGRALLRFGRSERASEIFNDVVDGIRSKISVGYVVHRYEAEEGKGDAPTKYRATDWEPHEVSFVSIPADASVGVGRDKPENAHEEEAIMPEEQSNTATPEVREEPTKTAPAVNIKAERDDAVTSERERSNTILRIADEHDMVELGRKHIDSDSSVADFQRAVLDQIGQRNNQIRAENPTDDNLGLSETDKQGYSIVRVMNALSAPLEHQQKAREAAAFEIEVGNAAADKLGIEARGIFIPSEVAFRDLSAGTATDGAELVADNLLAGSFIDVLRNQSALARLGATMLPGLVGNVDIPRQTSGSAATWIAAEDGDASESDPQFDQVSLTPKDLACYTEVTRRLIQQSTPAVEGLVRSDLTRGIALGLDSAGMNGSGSLGQPKGIKNQTGVNTFNFGAAQPTWAEVVRMIREVKLDNADMGSLAFLTDPNGWDHGVTTEKFASTGQTIIMNDRIAGYPYLDTNQVTNGDWFFGNFADVLMGMWGGLELNTDPYTHSLKGKVRFVVFQTADVAVRHAESFCVCNDGV